MFGLIVVVVIVVVVVASTAATTTAAAVWYIFIIMILDFLFHMRSYMLSFTPFVYYEYMYYISYDNMTWLGT